MSRQILERAVANHYSSALAQKGLFARAQPLLGIPLPHSPLSILVVGMALGGAEEVEAMKFYFPNHSVYGLDKATNVPHPGGLADLIYADLADMPFLDSSFGAVLCSAVLHEAYSYAGNGKEEVMHCFSEMSRVLVPGGICAVREAAAPMQGSLVASAKTPEAQAFISEFCQSFRNGYASQAADGLRSAWLTQSSARTASSGTIQADSASIYELLVHFRVAMVHHPTFQDFFGSKEPIEEYFPFNQDEYTLMGKAASFELVRSEYIDFPSYYPAIQQHFSINHPDGSPANPRFGYQDFTFRKIRKNADAAEQQGE